MTEKEEKEEMQGESVLSCRVMGFSFLMGGGCIKYKIIYIILYNIYIYIYIYKYIIFYNIYSLEI